MQMLIPIFFLKIGKHFVTFFIKIYRKKGPKISSFRSLVRFFPEKIYVRKKFFSGKNKFEKAMVKNALSTLEDSDLILLVVDSRMKINLIDRKLIDVIKKFHFNNF